MGVVVIIAIVWIVYMVATKDQRAAKKEQQKQEFEQKKQNMLTDPTVALMAESVVEMVTNLKDAAVKVLRQGGSFYLIFEKGSVYYETRWTEKVGDNYERRKNTQCILDRIDMGKNPLSDEENGIFRGIVYDKLKLISWLDVRSSYAELTVKKAQNATIPEAF